MDLEILFWLVFILAPILSRLFRGKKGKKPTGTTTKPRPRPRPARGPSGDGQPVEREKQLSPFQEALQQIQEAMAEAREEQARQQAAAEKAKREAREPKIEVREATFSGSGRKPERKPEKKAAPKKGYFESKSFESAPKPMPREVVAMPKIERGSFYDDEFESNKAYEEEFHETVHTHVPPSDDDLPKRKTKIDRSRWQQAYVMHEILRRPRSVRPWNAPMPGKDD